MWIIFIWRWVKKANDPEPVSNSCRLKSREEQTSRYLTTPPSTHQLSAFTSDRALNALHCTQPANASITDTFRSRDQTVHCPILQSLVLIVQFCDPFLIGDYYQFVTGHCIRAARKVFMIQSYHNHLLPPWKWKKILHMLSCGPASLNFTFLRPITKPEMFNLSNRNAITCWPYVYPTHQTVDEASLRACSN